MGLMNPNVKITLVAVSFEHRGLMVQHLFAFAVNDTCQT
jgi:hypothetical protein